jgi:hypothetical protein
LEATGQTVTPQVIESGIAITDVTVIDMTGAPPRPHMTLVVQNDRIVRLAPATDVQWALV